jgi:L-cysteine S-thiosulfotransferase
MDAYITVGDGIFLIKNALWCVVLAALGFANALAQPPTPAERGQALLVNRQASQCLLCHAAPLPDPHTHGNLAPGLQGVASRYTAAELRERLSNPAKFNPQSIMPSYAVPSPGGRVARAQVGKPIFTAEQLDDMLAYLNTLK